MLVTGDRGDRSILIVLNFPWRVIGTSRKLYRGKGVRPSHASFTWLASSFRSLYDNHERRHRISIGGLATLRRDGDIGFRAILPGITLRPGPFEHPRHRQPTRRAQDG